MFGRAKRLGNPSARAVADAVDASLHVANGASTSAYGLLTNQQSGVRTVFTASLKAVAGAKPGGMDAAAFKAALRAAVRAIDESCIPEVYERLRLSVESIPHGLVLMAARQAAGDAWTNAGLGRRGGDPLARMDDAAVKAAEDRMLLDDGVSTEEATVKAARRLAGAAVGLTTNVVKTAVPMHAAAVAMFEVGIRGAGRRDLPRRMRDTCDEMPELARPLGDQGVSMIAALSHMLLAAAENRRMYRTAVQSAEDACVKETIDRIVGMVDENAFEAAYGALAACAHAASGGRAFKSGYEEALAKACGVGTAGMAPDGLSSDAMRGMLKDVSPGMAGRVRESDLQDFILQMCGKMDVLFGSAEEAPVRKRLGLARGVDYKKVAADPDMVGILSAYKMAYDAGYEGAAAAAKGA